MHLRPPVLRFVDKVPEHRLVSLPDLRELKYRVHFEYTAKFLLGAASGAGYHRTGKDNNDGRIRK